MKRASMGVIFFPIGDRDLMLAAIAETINGANSFLFGEDMDDA